METPYSKAWKKFKESTEFEEAAETRSLNTEESFRPYLENRLQRAFDAGRNSKTSSILDALNAMADKGAK